MSESITLKTCPFCGSERVVCAHSFVGIYMIKCLGCGALVSFAGKEEKDDCVKTWNKRTSAYERAFIEHWENSKDN